MATERGVTILPSEKATELVSNTRRKTYGHPIHNFRKTVDAFHGLTGHRLTPQEGVVFMICVKLAREGSANYPIDYTDNVDDLAGYANVLALVKEAVVEAVGE